MTYCDDCGDECLRRKRCPDCGSLVCGYCWQHVHKEYAEAAKKLEGDGNGEEFDILDYLADSPQSVTAIAKQACLGVREVASMLVTVALNGTAVEVYSGAYARAKTAVTPQETS